MRKARTRAAYDENSGTAIVKAGCLELSETRLGEAHLTETYPITSFSGKGLRSRCTRRAGDPVHFSRGATRRRSPRNRRGTGRIYADAIRRASSEVSY